MRYPQAIAFIPWILALSDSAEFVAVCTIALSTPSGCALTIRAARTIGASRLRDSSAAKISHAFLAQPTLA